jgi:MYXO-CTERM domain-containing protein
VRPLLTCSPSIGAAPLDATCTATDLAWGDALTTSWTLEGESSSLDPFPVRIDVPRAVTVRGCASAGEACVEACEDLEIVACGPVVPAFDVLVNEDGTRQLENQTPTDPLGCVSSVRWTVYDGDAVVWRSTDWSPQVPASVVGTRVELLAEGPAGSATQDQRLDGGCGCASSDPTSAAALPLLAALLLRRRQAPHVQV